MLFSMSRTHHGRRTDHRGRTRRSRVTAFVFSFSCCAACSSGAMETSSDAPKLGSLRLGLELAPSVSMDEVSYLIERAGMEAVAGTIGLAHDRAGISAQVGLPIMDAYTVTLSGVSVGGDLECGGSANFDLKGDEAAVVNVVMSCRAPGSGAVRFEKTPEAGKVESETECPVLESPPIEPLELALGERLALGAAARSSKDARLNYSWEASSGTLGSPDEAATTFECTEEGVVTLTVRVSDGTCGDVAALDVVCSS